MYGVEPVRSPLSLYANGSDELPKPNRGEELELVSAEVVIDCRSPPVAPVE
jgi:hypothetical protein